jgi:mRNA-degrading endonuclease toxin of MazEF toxin-antitoxin module
MPPKPPPQGWYPRRGEVYIVRLDKPRPAIVISIDPLNKFAFDVCLVGITTVQHRNFAMRVPLTAGEGGLAYDCWAKCDQVSSVDKSYLRYPPIGVLSEGTFEKIEEQIKFSLGLR